MDLYIDVSREKKNMIQLKKNGKNINLRDKTIN